MNVIDQLHAIGPWGTLYRKDIDSELEGVTDPRPLARVMSQIMTAESAQDALGWLLHMVNDDSLEHAARAFLEADDEQACQMLRLDPDMKVDATDLVRSMRYALSMGVDFKERCADDVHNLAGWLADIVVAFREIGENAGLQYFENEQE